MEPSDLLRRITATFERLDIPYLITGSLATVVYGEPRFTNDIDVVAELVPGKVSALLAEFPDSEFYCSEDAVLTAIAKRGQFNIIHPASGLKVDVFLAGSEPFDQALFRRKVKMAGASDLIAWFVSPEDIIVKKLQYYKLGGSDKHIRDILGVFKILGDKVDRQYIASWVDVVGVSKEWQTILARISKT